MNRAVLAYEFLLMLLIPVNLIISLECLETHYQENEAILSMPVLLLVTGIHLIAAIPMIIDINGINFFFYWGDEYIEYSLSLHCRRGERVRLRKDDIVSVVENSRYLILNSTNGEEFKISKKAIGLLNGFAIITERLNELGKYP